MYSTARWGGDNGVWSMPCCQWRRGAGRDLTLLRPLGPSRVYHVNILTNRAALTLFTRQLIELYFISCHQITCVGDLSSVSSRAEVPILFQNFYWHARSLPWAEELDLAEGASFSVPPSATSTGGADARALGRLAVQVRDELIDLAAQPTTVGSLELGRCRHHVEGAPRRTTCANGLCASRAAAGQAAGQAARLARGEGSLLTLVVVGGRERCARRSAAPINRRREMPTRKMPSAREDPAPVRACTREAAGRRRRHHRRAQASCRGELPTFRSDRPDRSEPSYHDAAQPRRSHHPPRPERAPAGLRLQESCQLASAAQATDHADCGARGRDRQLEAIEGS